MPFILQNTQTLTFFSAKRFDNPVYVSIFALGKKRLFYTPKRLSNKYISNVKSNR